MTHYYNARSLSRKEMFFISIKLKNHDALKLFSGPGIFSKTELDKATKLMLESVDCEGENLLDLGCGNGVVGISAKKLLNARDVTFVDVSPSAISVAKENCKLHKLDKKVFFYDDFILDKEHELFDVILCNPPFASGKKVIFDMIEKSYAKLKNNGKAYFVARHKKGGESVQKHMEKTFGIENVSVHAKGSGFRVYKAILVK